MVTQNPDLRGLALENFEKAARQLKKITSELQDIVMSIRMVPLSATFQKMNRIVRDMSKKLEKSVRLQIIGKQTEVDKNIIEHISDPLMHLIRNAIDHGIRILKSQAVPKERMKPGLITLEAKNAGGDVLIIVKDDGKGLDREKILKRARENGLVNRPESELSNRDIYSLIFLPGFSTKESISEFSGRGVGMDVVSKNIGKINGSVSVDSTPDEGTVVTIKVPLTLAIIGGMNIQVGKAIYTIPTISVREAFRPGENDVFEDTEGNEMIMIRGQCYRILRLHRIFKIHTDVTRMHEGILIMVESDNRTICVFADALLGEQQVVVKGLPGYIKNVKGLAGCTLLGNGDISLILDMAQLNPIKKIAEIADKVAIGDLDVTVDVKSKNEIGRLASSFSNLIASTQAQASAIEKLADTDLTVEVPIRSEKDVMGRKLSKLVDGLNEIMLKISSASDQGSFRSKSRWQIQAWGFPREATEKPALLRN